LVVKQSKPTVISVAGPIASGKTTLAKLLTKRFSLKALLEPAPEKHNPFFSLYYSNPHNYTFHNEINFMIQGAELCRTLNKDRNPKRIYVQDHLPFANVAVYAYVQKEFGYLTRSEYELLKRVMGALETSYIEPNLIIYRHVSDDEMMARIRARARPGEASSDYKFFSSIKDRYDTWIKKWKLSPLLEVDETADVKSDTNALHIIGKGIFSLLKIND